jgi:hypothetical protein
MKPHLKSVKAAKIILIVLALLVAWIAFQLGTHRHTGVLRALVKAKHFLTDASISHVMPQQSPIVTAGSQHRVTLSWKASTSAVVGYNVYRRSSLDTIKLNLVPVAETTYTDRTVQPGQTYFYVTKAVNVKGAESAASNEIRADIPSP